LSERAGVLTNICSHNTAILGEAAGLVKRESRKREKTKARMGRADGRGFQPRP